MAVSIESSQTIDGNTFYRNRAFDINFSVVSSVAIDACLYFGNSTYGVLPYVSNPKFTSTTGIPTLGNIGTLSVDAVVADPRYVTSPTSGGYPTLGGVTTDPSGFVYFTVANQHRVFQMDLSKTVTVFAGDGTAGDTNGPRLTARFRSPSSVSRDSSGAFYVTDEYRLRKIDTDGTVSTMAGSTTPGFTNATGASARFRYPNFCLPRPTGDILVTDSDNHVIRNVTQDGIVTTYAGTGTAGFLDGSLAVARFYFPVALVYDSTQTSLYVADQYNHRIRTISNGTVSTYAGTGVAGNTSGSRLTALLDLPTGLTRDSNGALYIGSFQRNDIRILSNGTLSSYTGGYNTSGYVDGKLSVARFNGLQGLAMNGSNLYIAEYYNGRLRQVTTYPDVRPSVPRVPVGGTIVATSNYPIFVNSRIDTSWTSVGGVLPLFKFEPFSNTITAKLSAFGDTLTYGTPSSSTELLSYLTGTGTSSVSFRSSNGATVAYTYPLSLLVRAVDPCGTVLDDVSTSVTIGPARIIYSPCNASLVFYRAEPISPVTFSLVTSPAQIIYSASTLPAGLGFSRTASNAFTLAGTPSAQTITSNYTILGQDISGRTYSTVVSMVVNPERLVIDVSGSLSLSNITSNTPISPITFTSRFPPYGSERAMRYTWSPPPPAGIQFRDLCGTAISGSSYTVSSLFDPSFTLTLSGTMTPAQISNFAATNTRTYTMSLTGTRVQGGTPLSPSLPKTLTFTLEEIVLFTSNVPTLYVGLPVTSFSYSAKTYFSATVDSSIASIAVTDGFLPDGLTGTFQSNAQRFNITGTPTNLSNYTFTLTATNETGRTATLPVAISTTLDQVTITESATPPFSFIQFRSLSNAKTGSYPSPIRFSASATSGCNVVLTGSGFPAGITLSSNSPGVYELTGVPLVPTGSSTGTITGVAASGATATKLVAYSVSADTFTFTFDPSSALVFEQNVPIPPLRVSVETLSEQPVIRYSSTNLPSALVIENSGRILGTVEGSTSGNFTLTAFTAYSNASIIVPYTVQPDEVILQATPSTTTVPSGTPVSIQISGYSATGTTVEQYRFQSAFPYGLSINSNTGLLSGTLIPPLPASTTFTLLGTAGLVDGSLEGTMTTANLTVNRAQMLEVRDTSNLRIYSSDDSGLNWSSVFLASNVVASHIGTDSSNLYLVPTTTGTILRSTDGASYSTDVSISGAVLSAIANKAGTSTWWVGGTLSNNTGRSVYVFKSTNDGLTWDSGTEVTTNGFTDRAGNPASYGASNIAYLNGGVELAYKDGVLLLGGNQVLRSTDDGATWSTTASGLTEVASFSVDHETVWLAAGTDTYLSRTSYPLPPSTLAKTLKYSSDFGLSWTDVLGGFTMVAYQVKYGNGTWLASGFDLSGSTAVNGSVRSSFDGLTWTPVTSIPTYTHVLASDLSLSSPPVGNYPIALDDAEWKVLRVPADGTATLYSHSDATPLTSGWTSTTLTSEFSGMDTTSRFFSYISQTIDPGPDITTITFPTPPTGPVFVSPLQSTYVLWQYMPIPAITFTATGTSPITYFASSLPVGLTWTSATRTITGACMRTGTQTFTVYAKNSAGLTAFTVTLLVEVPRIIKKQTSAGAYTALVRDYTEVAAAINARDTRVNPVEESALGSFASPYAPDVRTPSNCPC